MYEEGSSLKHNVIMEILHSKITTWFKVGFYYEMLRVKHKTWAYMSFLY
jgi:hypothetical protein